MWRNEVIVGNSETEWKVYVQLIVGPLVSSKFAKKIEQCCLYLLP
jgi:hypothetical protein